MRTKNLRKGNFNHCKDRRGNCSRLILPKVKTEACRKTFAFQGTLIVNGLTTHIRNKPYFVSFKQKIDNLSFAQQWFVVFQP